MTKRIFAAVIAIAMVCTMFAFASSAAETTTVNLDSSVTAHGWNQILNAINFNDFDKNEDGWGQVAEAQNLRAILLYGTTLDGWTVNTEEPWNSVLYLKCKVVDLINAGIAWNGETPAADVLVCDYMQNTFGAAAYALRGGKQKAVDLWNSYVPAQPIALVGDNAYTVTANTLYTSDSYDAALNALGAYMTYAQDNQVCNVGTAGRWTAQKARYAALETALQGLVEGAPTPPEAPTDPTLVDMTGLTSADATNQLLINFYNNVDVESYRAKEVVQTWAAALKEGVEAGLAYDAILVGDVDVCTLWESTIRYEVLLAMGARTAADNVMNDASLWPLGAVIIDTAQTTYKAAQYQEVYDLWVQIRDEYKASTTVKTSEVIAACDTLKAKIQALEVASLPFTTEQKQAVQVLETFVPYYRARVNRIVLETNKATSMYTEYVALVEEAEGYIALDWTNGTSKSYPSVATMENLLLPGAEGGLLETNWYPFRLAFGLDAQGYDAVIAAAVAEWEASGLYSDASIAAVKESVAKYEVATMTGARSSSNTDELTQGDVEIYKSMLEAKPVLVDMTGLTSPDYVTQLLITFYNNVDVESYRAKEVVQTWAAALKAGVEAGLAYDAILVGDVDVCTLWESTIRYEVLLNMGARTAADAVMNDASLWPLGAVIIDTAQTTYKAAQYKEVYDLWVQIRDEYKASTTVKTSEVIAACDTLKAKIQALEIASLPFTTEQKQAAMAIFDKNSSAYGPAINMSALEIYQQRLNRVVLDVNKATDTYINFKALIDTAAAWATLDWENGTSASYPTLEEIRALLTFDAEGWITGGSLEDDWYPFRLAFGLDNAGYDAVIAAAVAEWEASGLYTDASIAAVKEAVANYEVATMTGARGSNNTDEQTQGDIVIYKAMLEEKPALPEFKVASASLSLGESIAINFKVNADVYTSYENVYGIAVCDGDEARIEGVLGADGKYAFSYSNLTPKMAKVPVTFTLYGTSGGQSYTKTVEYSIYKYCTNQFSKTTDEAFKTLLTDFINYAAALQVYTDYNTGDLANADFDQTYASATLTDPASQLNLTYATVENPTVVWKGAGLAIQDTVNARLTFQAADITGLTIKFVINGVTYSVDTFTPVSGYTDRYYVYFGDILPREMRSAFTATAYVNDVAVSNTIQYSIQSYVVGKTDLGTNLSDLLVAMLKFGDACAAYFG